MINYFMESDDRIILGSYKKVFKSKNITFILLERNDKHLLTINRYNKKYVIVNQFQGLKHWIKWFQDNNYTEIKRS